MINSEPLEHHLTHVETNPFRRLTRWLHPGWQLFRRAPARLFGLLVVLLIVEGLFQLTVPVAGIVLSKWVVGVLGGMIWLAMDNLSMTGRLNPLMAMSRLRGRWFALACLSLIQLVAFGSQLLVAWWLLGSAGLSLLLLAEPVPVSTFQLGLILMAGIPISTALIFTTPRLVIDRQTLGQAIVGGLDAARRHAGALSLLALLNASLVGLAPATLLLSILITGPFLFCVGFAAWQDAGRSRTEAT